MDDECMLLAEVLMEEAQAYLSQGLLDEAAELMAVAERLELGFDPFCDLGTSAIVRGASLHQ